MKIGDNIIYISNEICVLDKNTVYTIIHMVNDTVTYLKYFDTTYHLNYMSCSFSTTNFITEIQYNRKIKLSILNKNNKNIC